MNMPAFIGQSCAAGQVRRTSLVHVIRTRGRVFRAAPRRTGAATVTMAMPPHGVEAAFQAADPQVAVAWLGTLLADAAAPAAAAAAEVVEKKGFFDQLAGIIETLIVMLDKGLGTVGLTNAFGASIILFTFAIKVITLPLTFKQMDSTMKMQALAPKLEELKKSYGDNPQVMNQMTAELYKTEEVNPLAGCFPVLLQLPIWLSLYRALLNLAKDNYLDEPFLWLPSLQGPVSATGEGIDTWLFPLVNGAPPAGWHDALCYLVLPVLLVATQAYSQKIMQPAVQNKQAEQTNAILKFLPLMIGWFSLSVPSGLSVYWITNNVLSTAQTVYIKKNFEEQAAATEATKAVEAKTEAENRAEIAPPTRVMDKASGFGDSGAAPPPSPKKPKGKKKRKN